MNNPLYEENERRYPEPCILVVFGATGDLTARKLVPALYNLLRGGLLPSQFACVGFARREKSDAEFRQEMFSAVSQFSRTKPIDEAVWKHFQDHLFYHRSEFHDDEGYANLKKTLQDLNHTFGCKGNVIFYLATPASYFPLICEKLKKADLISKEESPWTRVIIEKPFGHNLLSAEKLQTDLLTCMTESQIFRIDHYLGKETVQNLLVFRFANSIFESSWNHTFIDHVQITVSEEQGIGSRGKLWEESGLLRDIVQNHMMQLLSLVAMEPPTSLDANAIRNEKVKVLQAIKPLGKSDFVRGQYGAGLINGEEVIGYREEENVSKTSMVETFAALRLFIDNKRWSGVPFYLRSGKRLPKRATEIAVIFKDSPHSLFPSGNRNPNTLVIRIQPDEGISLKINCKVPGPASPIQPVKMDFKYGSYFGSAPPEAYERLFCDAMIGDSTLFAREDEVLLSWKLLSPVLEQWEKTSADFQSYASGSWGPKAADDLLTQDDKTWRLL